MLRRRKEEEVVRGVVTVQLSDELKQALAANDNDMQVLVEFLSEVVQQQRDIIMAIQSQALAATEAAGEDTEVPFRRSGSGLGVRAFEGDPPPIIVPAADAAEKLDLSSALQEGRQRSSPFNRRPRHEQEAFMVEYLTAHPGWHHSHEVAKEFSGDEREFRYLKSAMSRTLKELYQSGRAEREDATQRGSMFRYRLKK